MYIKKPNWAISESEATPECIYKKRREIIKKLGILTATAPLASNAQAGLFDVFSSKETKETLVDPRRSLQSTSSAYSNQKLSLTPEKKVISYNNFYEFGANKDQPAVRGRGFKTNPWEIEIDGEVEQAITLDIDSLMKTMTIEERIYRMRCVEAWSMNIPWLGFTLSALLQKVKPTSKAKYVAFQTLYDPDRMPGQASSFLGGGIDYPYVEGLTIEEAMNPLTLMSVGLYGKTLAPQNGAPIRLVVPWKYGFKSIKSIVKITLTEHQPPTTWNQIAANEYGFYANVNPNVDHPRWSQASERFIGEGSLVSARRQKTLMFNGYSDEVAHLYKDIDLKRNY